MKNWEDGLNQAQRETFKKDRSKSRTKRFFIILGSGVTASAILWGPFGMVAGFIPVVVHTLFLTVLLEFDIL